mgnify:CR=1 FL=1
MAKVGHQKIDFKKGSFSWEVLAIGHLWVRQVLSSSFLILPLQKSLYLKDEYVISNSITAVAPVSCSQ